MPRPDCPRGAVPKVPLESLRCGEAARIYSLGGNTDLQIRLRNMGVREGEEILVVKCAPLADPIEYRIGGMHLSLRRSEARQILVTNVHDGSSSFARHPHPWRGRGRRHRGGSDSPRRRFGRWLKRH
jgi:Fe2+ transport system protein FeoA